MFCSSTSAALHSTGDFSASLENRWKSPLARSCFQRFFPVTLLAAGVVACLGIRPAHASLKFCNYTSETLYGAYAFELYPSKSSRSGDWESHGHKKVPVGECVTYKHAGLNLGEYFGRSIYVAASDGYGDWTHQGTNYFCVNNTKKFSIVHEGTSRKDNAQGTGWGSCYGLGDGYQSVGFVKTPALHRRRKRTEQRPMGMFSTHTYYDWFAYSRDDCTVNLQAYGQMEINCSPWSLYDSHYEDGIGICPFPANRCPR